MFNMQQKNKILNNLRTIVTGDKNVNVDLKQLEKKQSTVENAGLGVFALEDIACDTIFIECFDFQLAETKHIDKFINDLAYHGTIEGYDNEKNIEDNTNVGYVCQYNDGISVLFGGWPDKMFLKALKDIKKGEELSRHYGLPYWKQHEFWSKFPESKYTVTLNQEDLPSEYVFIDEIRTNLERNACMQLYGKKVNDEYHYFVSNERHDYMEDNFEALFKEKITVTKPDKSMFKFDENIYMDHYMTKYLKEKRFSINNSKIEHENNFWETHSYSKFRETLNPEDLPSDYICIDRLLDGKKTCYESKCLYAKKVNGLYYYLMSNENKKFDEFDQSVFTVSSDTTVNKLLFRKKDFDETNCTDVSKEDYSAYEISDKIQGMTRYAYRRLCEENKRNNRTQLRNKFFSDHNIDKQKVVSCYGDVFNEDMMIDKYLPIGNLIKDGDPNMIRHMLYCKKISDPYLGDFYHYLMRPNDGTSWWDTDFVEYYEPEFEELSKTFVDVTKPHKTKYDMYEKFPNGMHTELYVNKKMMDRINYEKKTEQYRQCLKNNMSMIISGAIITVAAISYYIFKQ